MPTTTAGSIVKQEKEKSRLFHVCLRLCGARISWLCCVIINNPLGLYLFCAHVFFYGWDCLDHLAVISVSCLHLFYL